MKRGLGQFWKLFWIGNLVLQLVLSPSVQGQRLGNDILGGTQSTIQLLESTQQMRRQIQYGQMYDMSSPKYRAPDDLELGCAMPPLDIPPQIPSCQQAPEMAGFLSMIFARNAQHYLDQEQPGQSMHTPIGIKCLEEKAQILNSRFADFEQILAADLDRIKNQAGPWFSQIQDDINSIKDINALLHGGNSGRVEKEAIDFVAFFQNADCRKTIAGGDANREGQKGGLRGIRDQFLNTKQTRAREVQGINFEKAVGRTY